jgi:hypothetical protein
VTLAVTLDRRYKWDSTQLFSDKDVPSGIEDMYLWQDARGSFHALFHIMDTNQGGHGFSEDGHLWEWGGLA